MYRSDDPASNAVEAPSLMTFTASRSADPRGAVSEAESGLDSDECDFWDALPPQM